MNGIIKFKLGGEPHFRYIEATNCPLYTEVEENGETERVICLQTTEDFVHDTISQYLQRQGLQGGFHSIEVIEKDRLIATAENLRAHGSLKLKSSTFTYTIFSGT